MDEVEKHIDKLANLICNKDPDEKALDGDLEKLKGYLFELYVKHGSVIHGIFLALDDYFEFNM